MMFRCLAFVCVAACGRVNGPPAGVDAAGTTPDGAVTTIAYKGTLSQTTPSMFGGTPYCNYTMTLKQLEVDLAMLPSGQATSGTVQALNVEGTDASCPNGVIPASIANYTLSSSSPAGRGTTLTFQGAADNVPMVSLVATLTASGSAYIAALTFHRTDQPPPLDWSVHTTITLSPQ